MQVLGIISVAIVPVLGLFLTIGGYILQRDRYWRQIWKDMGEPDVESIRQLKELYKSQDHPASDRKRRELIPYP